MLFVFIRILVCFVNSLYHLAGKILGFLPYPVIRFILLGGVYKKNLDG